MKIEATYPAHVIDRKRSFRQRPLEASHDDETNAHDRISSDLEISELTRQSVKIFDEDARNSPTARSRMATCRLATWFEKRTRLATLFEPYHKSPTPPSAFPREQGVEATKCGTFGPTTTPP
jgi:hypothetical protein